MDKQELDNLEKEILDDASSSLSASIEYLNGMIHYFESDTKKLHKLATHSMVKVAKRGFKDGPEYSEWQTYERALIRAVFAEVEGITMAMRKIVLWASERGDYNLSEIEYANLSEKDRFNTCKDNFILAFKNFTSLFGSPYKINKQSPKWNTFLNSIKIRDGLMHPKSPLGFQISGDAANDIEETIKWLGEIFKELIESLPNVQGNQI